ncbi:uncharacterized protein N7500_007344 [Penicillium coprophilum]|uniref:uncharacterized protein n=1 Tax=Penicillium coprophilum TaxID=36646 RepID=UPI0023A03A32|nr:uncharacterized protein N7500_007344 [Penicillium coprophilum]KAJ5165514.1 hypothetical protein N7500_007344 [Penicillium coprophilum]
MLLRILQSHQHLFRIKPTIQPQLLLLNSARHYPSLHLSIQTACSAASTTFALTLPQLAAQYSSYSSSPGKLFRNTPSKMATATKINLSPVTDLGIYSSNVRGDTARTVSEILQEDMTSHHVFFNEQRFHNHIPHQLLSIYALGAAPEDIKACYERNKSYQRPALPTSQDVIQSMHDVAQFQEYFGKEEHYPNYLAFFQHEIDAKGVAEVLNIYVFAGDERAESMMCRLFGGLVHPLIHLGFGIEFNQPAIVAQGLAQAAVHDDWLGRAFFLPAEKLAGGIGKPGQKSLLQLLNEMRADKALIESVKWSDSNKIKDGVLHRAPEQMLKYASQYTVSEDQVEERLADMINTVAYYTSAAQRPTREMRLDFFFIHCVNSSIFFSKILILPFLDQKSKLRMLEWKGRIDLLMYISRGTPDLLLDEVANYPMNEDWSQIFARSIAHPGDDGHLAKLARALAHGQHVCQAYESKHPEVPIKGDMWLRIGNIAVDSTVEEGDRPMWVRSTGFDEAWEPQQAHL